jgi:hypothetical protein
MKKVLILCLIFAFVGCQQEDIPMRKKVISITSDPMLVGKRLAFGSKEHLAYFVNQSKTKDLNELKSKISKYEESGFRSLLPTFESTNVKRLEEFKAARQARHHAGREDELQSIDAEEDELIHDPNYALLLNEDREIIVEDQVYQYTEYAVFYTETSNDAEIANYVQQVQDCQLSLAPGETNLGDGVYAFIPEPIEDICAYETDTYDVAYVPAAVMTTKDQFMATMETCVYSEHGFDHIFGPSKTCIDKFASDRRIKNRAWNQNYFLYASVGIRTKTQKRTLGIWWASDSDEIELGYEVVKFMFEGVDMSGILNQIRANSLGLNYVYSYNGYLLNQYGIISSNNQWSSGSNLFNAWPISDPDSRVLKIYLGENITTILEKIDAGLTTVDGKEFNSAVKALAKQGWDAVAAYLGEQSSGGVVIAGGDPYKQKFYFVYTNWKNNNRNDNRISKVFDFNTGQIGFSLNPGNGTSWGIESMSKSYKEYAVSCYGVARRGSEWRGSRIVLVEKKD